MATTVTVPRRTKRPESRRQELLAAALALFTERGVAEPTVADITDAAGAAKGTFYRYFDTKDDLIAALQEDYAAGLSDALEDRLAATAADGPAAQLRAYVEAGTRFYLSNTEVHHLLFRSSAGDGSSVHDLSDDAPVMRPLTLLRDLVGRGVADGAFAAADPDFTAYFLFSGFHAVLDREMETGSMGRERLIERVVELFVQTLRPEGGGGRPRLGRGLFGERAPRGQRPPAS